MHKCLCVFIYIYICVRARARVCRCDLDECFPTQHILFGTHDRKLSFVTFVQLFIILVYKNVRLIK